MYPYLSPSFLSSFSWLPYSPYFLLFTLLSFLYFPFSPFLLLFTLLSFLYLFFSFLLSFPYYPYLFILLSFLFLFFSTLLSFWFVLSFCVPFSPSYSFPLYFLSFSCIWLHLFFLLSCPLHLPSFFQASPHLLRLFLPSLLSFLFFSFLFSVYLFSFISFFSLLSPFLPAYLCFSWTTLTYSFSSLLTFTCSISLGLFFSYLYLFHLS